MPDEKDRDISPEGLPKDTRKPLEKDIKDLREFLEEGEEEQVLKDQKGKQ